LKVEFWWWEAELLGCRFEKVRISKVRAVGSRIFLEKELGPTGAPKVT
jgi:hypothetical protein